MMTRRTPPRGHKPTEPDPRPLARLEARIPADLADAVAARAASEDRTVTAWLIRAIKAALAKGPAA